MNYFTLLFTILQGISVRLPQSFCLHFNMYIMAQQSVSYKLSKVSYFVLKGFLLYNYKYILLFDCLCIRKKYDLKRVDYSMDTCIYLLLFTLHFSFTWFCICFISYQMVLCVTNSLSTLCSQSEALVIFFSNYQKYLQFVEIEFNY